MRFWIVAHSKWSYVGKVPKLIFEKFFFEILLSYVGKVPKTIFFWKFFNGLGYVGCAFGLPPNLEWDAYGPRLLRNLGVWFLHYRLRLSEVPQTTVLRPVLSLFLYGGSHSSPIFQLSARYARYFLKVFRSVWEGFVEEWEWYVCGWFYEVMWVCYGCYPFSKRDSLCSSSPNNAATHAEGMVRSLLCGNYPNKLAMLAII